jgi:hypothetical protein
MSPRSTPCSSVRIPAKSRKAAHRRYVRFLQLSLSCVSGRAHFATGPRPYGKKDDLALTTIPERIRLARQSKPPIFLSAAQEFHFVRDPRHSGEWKVQTDAYIYHLFMSDEDVDQLFARHWHPSIRPGCHLHVGPRSGRGRALYRLHVPMGRVAFEEVLRFLIDEFEVRPARKDWGSILSESQARFEAFRTWPGVRR